MCKADYHHPGSFYALLLPQIVRKTFL